MLAVLTGIGGLLLVDLVTDQAQHATGLLHLAAEAVAAGVAIAAAAWALFALQTRKEAVQQLSADLAVAKREEDRWRQEANELMRDLSLAIDRQFGRWALTSAEREIALLLLKGLSLREIGEVRSTRESTVRQQAQGIYRKAGLQGRADLAAFFLEDLLSPVSTVPSLESPSRRNT